jgi:hypothetical protein
VIFTIVCDYNGTGGCGAVDDVVARQSDPSPTKSRTRRMPGQQ